MGPENITMPPQKTSKKEVGGASVTAREAKKHQATRYRKKQKKSFPNTSNNYLKQLALVGRRTGSAKITKK